MNVTIISSVEQVLAELDEPQDGFVATRYPFTYAYDFARQHPKVIGLGSIGSRGEASAAITVYAQATGQNRGDVVIALANGYLSENRIRSTFEGREARLAAARAEHWKSMGLNGPA